MKKLLLIIITGIPAFLSAQNGVTVSNLVAAGGTVTFNVSWETPMPVEVWLDSVWVFADYNNAGTITRVPLAAGATLTATSAPGTGRVAYVDGNNKGVWVIGNARSAGSFTATVKLLTATATANLHGLCVYAVNYPPVGEYTSANTIQFTGTPPYELLFGGGGTASLHCSAGTPCTYTLPDGETLAAFTDATSAPGTFAFSCVVPVITPAATTFARCGAGTLTLSVNVTGGSAVTVNWYADEECTQLLQENSTSFTTPPLTATTTYYIKATNNNNPACAAQLQIPATINLYEGGIGGQED
jgi:hypothetical protein